MVRISRFGLVLLLGLGACASIPPEPKQAALRPAQDFNPGAAVAAAPIDAWPAAEWWSVLGDPQLNRLLTRAIAGNPRIAVARTRVETARALSRVAGSAERPTIAASSDFEYTRFTHDGYLPGQIDGHDLFGPPVWNNSVGVGLEYHLDFWGRDRALLQAALAEVKVAEYEERDARIALQSALIRSYAELSYAYALEDDEQSILHDEERTLDLANRRLRAGLGTELEIEQASSAIARSQGDLQVISERKTLLTHQIAALCGDGPGAGEALSRPQLSLDEVSAGLPSYLPAEILGRRPDLLAQRYRVEAAAKQVKVAQTAFYPNVDLKALVGLVGIGFGDFFSRNAFNASAGPAITLPIFEGGKLTGTLDARRAQYDAAVEAYNVTLIDALGQVADALSRYQSSSILAGHRQENLKLASRAHELALIAFRSGLTDFVNVLTTQNEWHRAQNQLAQVSLEKLRAISDLNQALGGGLPAADARLAASGR